jgi:regulator of sigma E protease
MVTLILFVLIFGVVVISHEFGHFLLAKANGIHVIEFSVGMGPNLFSFQKGDTKYSLKLLPIGGACMFEGEDGLNEKEDGEDHSGSFLNANVWARMEFSDLLFHLFYAFSGSQCCHLQFRIIANDFQSLGSDGAGRPQNCYLFHSAMLLVSYLWD